MSGILSEFPLERIESALHETGSFATFDARGHCQCRTVTKLKQKSVSNCGAHPTSGVRTDQSGPMDACVGQKVTLPFEFILKSEPSRSRKWFWRCNQATRGAPHPRLIRISDAHVALIRRSSGAHGKAVSPWIATAAPHLALSHGGLGAAIHAAHHGPVALVAQGLCKLAEGRLQFGHAAPIDDLR